MTILPTRAAIEEVLNAIIDPCSRMANEPAGLVDMGMVNIIEMTPKGDGADIFVELQLTEPTCIMGNFFIPKAIEGIKALPGVGEVRVFLNQDFGWSEARMSKDYRARLAARRAADAVPPAQSRARDYLETL
jgi:metal-sulfur cluster biosynthetic enzyme